MANPNVDALQAELSTVLERCIDRWQKAIAAARVANYPYQQFAADVTEWWLDTAYAVAYPWSMLGLFTVKPAPAMPTVHFVVDAAKADQTKVIPVGYPPAVTQAVSADLHKGGDAFPAANIAPQLSQNGYLLVTLQNMGAIGAPPPAGLYVGFVMGQPANVRIARVELEWPG
jgi:hypothetical protein